MYKTMQSGRSMVEMLGVLAIIGVLSVGGLATISAAQHKREETQLISDVAQLGSIAKKLSCQYDDAYSTYTNFLNKSEAIPSHLTYKNGHIEGVMDTNIEIEGDISYFVIKVTGLNESACMKLATTDWGKRNSNGCLGVSIGSTDMAECMISGNCSGSPLAVNSSNTNKYPMTLDVVSGNNGCSGNKNTVQIWFKACY